MRSARTLRESAQVSLLLAVLLLLLSCLPQRAPAQPQLNFKRIINNWPTIELYMSPSCDGQKAYFTDKKYFTVVENGRRIRDFELWCPDPSMRCALSATLVFDAGGAMSGAGNAGARAAGNTFADMMDGITDEAAVLRFNSVVSIQQGMTTSRAQLHAAIDALPAAGGAAVRDGIYEGVVELITSGVNQCRAVIALTAGRDDASTRSIAEIIALANRNRVRVFTIGLGDSIDAEPLRTIANLTGGRYYETPSAWQLVAIYQEITTIIFQGFQECLITYQASCMDGSRRTVDLSLVNFCGGSDTQSKTFKALRDTTTFSPLRFRIGSTDAAPKAPATVPLQLLDSVAAGTTLGPAAFTVLFDTSCVRFAGIATPPGSLLHGVPITITPIAGGVTFETVDGVTPGAIRAPATLAELTFTTSAQTGKDSVCCPLTLAQWTFASGCFAPQLQGGAISILSRQPHVICSISAPDSLAWTRAAKDYAPNPFTVGMALSNTGDREARNTRVRIICDTAALTLVSPPADAQALTPAVLDPAGRSVAQWELRAKRRLAGDSVAIRMQATFDNHPMVECAAKVWVPPVDAELQCRAWGPSIAVDTATRGYAPMPFTVNAMVTNTGGRRTDTVFATITVPKDLTLSGPDAPDRMTKRVLPAMLAPGQEGGVSWTLWHPPSAAAQRYRVSVCFTAADADPACCEMELVIPPMEAPMLYPLCSAPDFLQFDTGTNAYSPDPFTAGMTLRNLGGREARNVRFRILCDTADLSLIPPQADTLTGNPPDLRAGGQAEAQWLLRAQRRLTGDSVTVHIRAAAGNHDTVECRRTLWIPASRAAVHAEGPTMFCRGDSVRLSATPGFERYAWSTGDSGESIIARQSGAYRCRVQDSHGRQAWTDTLAVAVISPKPDVIPPGQLAICEGSSVTLTVQGAYRSYRWSTGDTARQIVVDSAGVYAVTVMEEHGCEGTSDSVRVAVLPIPAVTVTGPPSVCPASTSVYHTSILLSISTRWAVSSGGRIAAYSGDSAVVDWLSPGAQWIAVRHELGTGCSVSDTMRVTVVPRIIPIIRILGATALCEGDTVILDAGSGFAAYRWSTGASSRSIVVADSGTFTVVVTDSLGCTHSSRPLPIAVHPKPPVPVITQSGNLLTAGAGPWTYRWSRDGVDIPGQTTNVLLITEAGSYRVTVIDSSGCRAESDPLQAIVGIETQAPQAAEPSVFPDPSRGVLTVRVPARPGETMRITVVDMLGRELLRTEGVSTSGEYRTSLRIAPAVPGTYYVSIACGSSRWVRAVRVY
jgi:hypothetical protein